VFLIYINDVVDLYTDGGSCIKLYADGVKLYLEIENDSDVAMLQQSVDKFGKWAVYRYLRKSVVIYRVSKKNPVDYHIDGVALNTVDKVRDLGIIIDTKLTFVEHINLMIAKAHRQAKRANQILRCFLSKDNEILVKAFITHVRPILECSSPVWSLRILLA